MHHFVYLTTRKLGEGSVEPERRRFLRCSVCGSAIKVFTQDAQRFYLTRNISKVGLAFEYGPVEGEVLESGTIDIMALDYEGQLYLTGLACRTVYDTVALMEGRSFKGGKVRVRGLEFIELSADQEKILDELLDQCFTHSA
jgi:hypothetical protein